MTTTKAMTLADEPEFLEKFGSNTTAKSLFKKLGNNEKYFIMNNTNGNFETRFVKEYVDAHESNRPRSLEKMLSDLGYDSTKNYEPKAQQEEKKIMATASKSLDRWTKIVLNNIVRVIFGIKMDDRGYAGLEDDLRSYFTAKKTFDLQLLQACGVTDQQLISRIRQAAISRAYSSFLENSVPKRSTFTDEVEAMVVLIGAHYKNYYFAAPLDSTPENEHELASARIEMLILQTAEGLALTGGFDKAEMVEEVKEALPQIVTNLSSMVQEML